MKNHLHPRKRVAQGHQSSNLGSSEDASLTQQTMRKKAVKNPFISTGKVATRTKIKCILMLILIMVILNETTKMTKSTVPVHQKDEHSAIESAARQQSAEASKVVQHQKVEGSAIESARQRRTSRSITKAIHGKNFTINVFKDNDIVSEFAARPNGWEPHITEEITSTLKTYSDKHSIPLSDLTFVDIGANVGWFTMNMAAFGANVIAFEPMQDNIDLIQKSLEEPDNVMNGVSGRVKFYPHGLGTKDEVCTIYSHNINVGDGIVKCVNGDDGEKNLKIPNDYSIRGRIPVHRLDDVVDAKKEGLNIVVIKMDTEGYECNVLEGGSNLLLRSGARVIFTEFEKGWMIERDGNPEKFMKDIADAGYRLRRTTKVGGHIEVANPLKVDVDFMTKEEMIKAVISGDLSSGPHDLMLCSAEHLAELYSVEAAK